MHLDQHVHERMNKTTLRLFCTAYNIFASANIASIKVEYFDRLWVKENKYLNKQKSLFHNPLVGLGVTAWKVQHKIYRTIIITRSQPAPLMQILAKAASRGANSGYGWQLRNIEKINGALMIGGQDTKYVL